MSQEPNIVDPCKGWATPCSFCDKRFSKWQEPEEEVLSNEDLAKPGLFMLALESKQGKEVVVIGSHPTDVRVGIKQKLPTVRQQTSQKKNKESKSNILLRFLNIESENTKEACVVFSHWFNYGIRPRLITQWPGLTALKNTQFYQFSELCNKYCHPIKDTFWKKEKTNLLPRAVKPCKGWKDTCSFCDSRFTTWLPHEEALKIVPAESGLVMHSKNRNGVREIVFLCSSTSISKDISYGQNRIDQISRYGFKPEKKENYVIEVRWLVAEDLQSEDICFVYAHWINNKVKPSVNADTHYCPYPMPGEEILSKSETFTFRQKDKQWCYEGELTRKAAGYSKSKGKRMVQESIEEDMLMKN